jgi:uncharacterized protein YdaU (DUF1376 family)
MNYYNRYMADYAQKTARLSLAEHGAYTLLLDEVYSTEKPLPSDYPSLYRICRAMDKREQDAVKSVADTYFALVDGVRTNPRAIREITKAAPAMEAARLNGKKGGRPKNKPNGVDPNNPVGFSDLTQTEPSAKASQSSYTTIPNGIDGSDAKPRRPSKVCPDDFKVDEPLIAWAATNGITIDINAETQKFRNYTYKNSITSWAGAWRNWMLRAQEYSAEKQASKSLSGGKYAAAAAAIYLEDAPTQKQKTMDMGEVIDV